MKQLPKFVFSRTLDQAGCQNTHLVKTDAAAVVVRLKQQPGRDLFIFSSEMLAASLIQDGLMNSG